MDVDTLIYIIETQENDIIYWKGMIQKHMERPGALRSGIIEELENYIRQAYEKIEHFKKTYPNEYLLAKMKKTI